MTGYLLDTHVLLWAAQGADQLSAGAREIIADPTALLYYSVASIWEVGIKFSLDRPDFQVHPAALEQGLRGAGYRHLSIDIPHATTVPMLPPHHRDPFDRMLVAQAAVEHLTLVTHDAQVAKYPHTLHI